MDEGGRRVLHRSEVNVTGRFAARALDLQPREAAVDGLGDGRRRIDRLVVAALPRSKRTDREPSAALLSEAAFLAKLGHFDVQGAAF